MRLRFKRITSAEERTFERESVLSRETDYLSTNPLDRYETDQAYREKVARIAADLSSVLPLDASAILDIGGNTAGEATILSHLGWNIAVGDINEEALRIARDRCSKFGLRQPYFIGLDVADIPLSDQSVDGVVVIEALHHFPDYSRALSEVHRVLRPGGFLYSIEPNGLNPIRRLSEVRDRLRGTIEKSFFRFQLRRLLRSAGFENVRFFAYGTKKSSWKMLHVPSYRRLVALLHGQLSARFPRFFGSHIVIAQKPGIGQAAPKELEWTSRLRDPIGNEKVSFVGAVQRWVAESGRYSYPDVAGIPVLIREDVSIRSRTSTPPPSS